MYLVPVSANQNRLVWRNARCVEVDARVRGVWEISMEGH